MHVASTWILTLFAAASSNLLTKLHNKKTEHNTHSKVQVVFKLAYCVDLFCRLRIHSNNFVPVTQSDRLVEFLKAPLEFSEASLYDLHHLPI